MSSATPRRRFGRELASSRVVRQFGTLVVGSARFAGFWSAVVLPFALLGLAVTGSATEHASVFGGLLVANLVALRVGQRHGRD
jgi:hypothetical protein